jgi:hypothetical protein
VAIELQGDLQVDVLAVDTSGALRVSWLLRGADARLPWASAAVSAGGLYPPGAKLATLRRAGELDAFVVGSDGALHQASVSGLGAWSDRVVNSDGAPPRLGHDDCVHGGCARPAAGLQGAASDELDVAVVDADGVLRVFSSASSAGAVAADVRWHAVDPFDGQRLFVAGADVAAARQPALGVPGVPGADDPLELFAVGRDGALAVVSSAGGAWTRQTLRGPRFIVGDVPAGAHVAVAPQGPLQLDVALVGKSGTVQVYWSTARGTWAATETAALGLGAPGSPLVLVPQNDGGLQLDALLARGDGIFGLFTIGGPWLGPFRAL